MKGWLITGIIIVIIAGGIYFGFNNNKITECDKLALAFDKKVNSVQNLGYEGNVGGTLLEVSDPYFYVPEDNEQNKTTYTLTFKGLEKEGKLYLRTYSNKSFSYEVGKFYKIDLSNIRPNGHLSGSYFDFDMDKLQVINCS